MSIEKITMNHLKQVKLPFTSIFNETMAAIKDPIALAIYVYLLSKPDNWIIREKDIMNRFNIGRDSVLKRLKILKSIGLITKEAIRDEKGLITRWETTLHIHTTENPDSGQSSIWKTNTHTKERDLQNKDIKNIISEADASPATATPKTKLQNQVTEEYHDIFPDAPKIQVLDDSLKNAITKMQKEWSKYTGSEFSLESWRVFLIAVKKQLPWFFEPYKTEKGNTRRNSLRTLVRPTNLAKIRNNEFN